MPTPELESAQARLIQQAYESVEIPEGEFRTAERAIEMCKKYNAHYPIESFEVVKKDGQPLVELPFAAPLGKIRLRGDFDVEVPVIWTGRIDMVIRVSEQLFVLDHKTTSMLGATYFSEFYNSNQMKGYIWYVQQALKTPVSGAFINALANRKPTKTGVAIEFARDKIYYDSTVIEEWPKNVLSICSNFLNQCEDDYFPMHEKWCVAKYGKCPYFEVCTLSPDQRPIMLNSGMYQNVTWNPLNPIKKNEIVS